MQMIFCVIVTAGILYHLITVTTSCATEPKKAETLLKTLNSSFDFLCSSHCYGSFIFERQNSSTGQYNVIKEQSMYLATFNISQYSDGGIYRCRCNYTSEYCYLNVQVVPTMVKMNFTQATLNEGYLGVCSAEGNPRPMIHANFNSVSSCNYTMTQLNISDFTSLVKFCIRNVTEQCQNTTISCGVHQIRETVQLNVSRSNQEAASNNPSNHTSVNSTKNDPPLPTPPTQGGDTSISSSLMVVLTGLMTAIYWL